MNSLCFGYIANAIYAFYNIEVCKLNRIKVMSKRLSGAGFRI